MANQFDFTHKTYSNMPKLPKLQRWNSVYNQLLSVWNSIDVQMRLHIPMPTETTTMTALLQDLDARMPVFEELANCQRMTSVPRSVATDCDVDGE